jgi:hypothetical protein
MNQGVGGSNPSGRAKKLRFFEKVPQIAHVIGAQGIFRILLPKSDTYGPPHTVIEVANQGGPGSRTRLSARSFKLLL